MTPIMTISAIAQDGKVDADVEVGVLTFVVVVGGVTAVTGAVTGAVFAVEPLAGAVVDTLGANVGSVLQFC